MGQKDLKGLTFNLRTEEIFFFKWNFIRDYYYNDKGLSRVPKDLSVVTSDSSLLRRLSLMRQINVNKLELLRRGGKGAKSLDDKIDLIQILRIIQGNFDDSIDSWVLRHKSQNNVIISVQNKIKLRRKYLVKKVMEVYVFLYCIIRGHSSRKVSLILSNKYKFKKFLLKLKFFSKDFKRFKGIKKIFNLKPILKIMQGLFISRNKLGANKNKLIVSQFKMLRALKVIDFLSDTVQSRVNSGYDVTDKLKAFSPIYKRRLVKSFIEKKRGCWELLNRRVGWEAYKKRYRYKNFNKRSSCFPKFLHSPIFNKFLNLVAFKSKNFRFWPDISGVSSELKKKGRLSLNNAPLYLYYMAITFSLFSFSSRQKVKKYRRDIIVTIIPYLLKKNKTYFHAIKDFRFFLKKKKNRKFKEALASELSLFKKKRHTLAKTESHLFILKKNKVTLVAENSQYLHYRWR